MAICLLPEKIKEFREALKTRKLDINKLFDEATTTEQRVEVFREFAGENALDVTRLFEEKLILKNKVAGLKNAIAKLGEIGRYNPGKMAELQRMLSEYRKSQSDRILSPKEGETFLKTLTDKVLGTEVTKAEAKQVFELAQKRDGLLTKYDKATETWESQNARAEYGAAQVVYEKYVENLKTGNLPIKGIVKEYTQQIKDLYATNKPAAVAQVLKDGASTLSRNLINAVASWDNSFMGRQGAITLTRSPKIWWNMARKSMVDFYETLKGSEPQDVLRAEVTSRPNYLNGNYEKAKLLPKFEEETAGNLLERVPVAGRLYKASATAFEDSAIRARTDLFDMMLDNTKKSGVAINDAIIRDLGTVVNTITARGKVGKIGSSAPVQLLMWAPKMLKADWDILTGHTLGSGLETSVARKQAARNTFGVMVATAGVAAIAEALGADVEKDPRSTDFLKIKINNTRISIPFARGIPQIVVLMSRLLSRQTKNGAGIVRDLNTGEYGSQTLWDVGLNFLTNKTSPPAGAVIDWLEGRNFEGDKPTIKNTLEGFIPISVQNFLDLKDDAPVEAIVGAFLDLFGVGSNTYSSTDANWEQSTSKELLQFKERVGDEKFKELNDEYNKQLSEWLLEQRAVPNDWWKNLTSDEKDQKLLDEKNSIKDTIFKRYGFKYRTQK